MEEGRLSIRKVLHLSDIFPGPMHFEIVAIDIPVGLLDAYEAGGRACDRAARKLLGRPRGSSVFPAPVRAVLAAAKWEEACILSRSSAPWGKALSKQTFGILDKIREVDGLLQTRPELRKIIREVHPEVCFSELASAPVIHRKTSSQGREERWRTLSPKFPDLQEIKQAGRGEGLLIEDVLDATVACWSALRLAVGKGRSLPDPVPLDSTGLQMAIWV
jgi:predicted RNase H-like nuclease